MGKISSKKLHDIVEYEKFKISINTNSLANENSMYTTETIGLLAVMATMIIGYKDNLLIIPTSYGTVVCYEASTGTKYWEHDFGVGFYSSPILVDGKIYLMDKKGTMHIFKFDKEFKIIVIFLHFSPVIKIDGPRLAESDRQFDESKRTCADVINFRASKCLIVYKEGIR